MNSREKGKRGELELAKTLRGYGYDARRTVQYSGKDGDGDLCGLPGIHIECKRNEHLNITDALTQSTADAMNANRGEIPVVMHRKNNERWKVTMDLKDFMRLYGRWVDEQ